MHLHAQSQNPLSPAPTHISHEGRGNILNRSESHDQIGVFFIFLNAKIKYLNKMGLQAFEVQIFNTINTLSITKKTLDKI